MEIPRVGAGAGVARGTGEISLAGHIVGADPLSGCAAEDVVERLLGRARRVVRPVEPSELVVVAVGFEVIDASSAKVAGG